MCARTRVPIIALGLAFLLVGITHAGSGLHGGGIVAAAPGMVVPTATPLPPTAAPSLTSTPESAAPPTPMASWEPGPPSSTPPDSPPALPVNLAVETRADAPQAMAGARVVVTVRVVASETGSAAQDVEVTTMVPDELTVIDLASTRGDIVVQGQQVRAFPVTLAAGEEVILTITTTVRDGAAPGSTVTTTTMTTSSAQPTEDDHAATTVVITPPGDQPPTPAPAPALPTHLPKTSDPLADDAGRMQQLLLIVLGIVLLGWGATIHTVLRPAGLARQRIAAHTPPGAELPRVLPSLMEEEPPRPAPAPAPAPARRPLTAPTVLPRHPPVPPRAIGPELPKPRKEEALPPIIDPSRVPSTSSH